MEAVSEEQILPVLLSVTLTDVATLMIGFSERRDRVAWMEVPIKSFCCSISLISERVSV